MRELEKEDGGAETSFEGYVDEIDDREKSLSKAVAEWVEMKRF